MSHKMYSEVEPSDSDITDYLDELYPEPVTACGMKFTQSYILKHLDRVAFDMVASNNMQWYQCDVCGEVYKGDDAEEKARECCQNYRDECGKELDDEFDGELCEDCEAEENEDED